MNLTNQKKALGLSISNQRKKMNLTQQELADITESERGTISAIEIGKYFPSMKLFFKISTSLNIRPEELIKEPLKGVEICTTSYDAFSDPNPNRHNLTAYVCREHFRMIVGRFG